MQDLLRDEVTEFAERLARLTRAEWIAIGAGVQHTGATSAATAILHATIGLERLDVQAWYTRELVRTAAFYASEPSFRWGARDYLMFAEARVAAERAALTLLVRSSLSAQDADLLLAPFTSSS